MIKQNNIQSFIFQDINVSGNIVKLDDIYQQIIDLQDAKGAAAELLGQVILAATMLIKRVKIECEMTIQFQSDSEIKLLAVKIDTEGHLRATLNCNKQPQEALLGKGFLVITIRQLDNKQHQSVVTIQEGQSISSALAGYFVQSEQMPTLFHLVAKQHQGAGIMLQRPQELVSNEDWNTIVHLFNSLTDEELLSLDNQTILTRLFHEYNLKLFEPSEVSFSCSCSYEKMRNVITSIGEQEANNILANTKIIQVKCEYCKTSYDFDKNDIKNIFTQH